MNLRVLGCSGGIGQGLRTTSFLVDGKLLIDAGTGVGDLPVDALHGIEHVLLTHAHMDHITCLPMLCDVKNVGGSQPLTVYAPAETIAALRQHVFNWRIWPDFGQIPSPERPILNWQAVAAGESWQIGPWRVRVLPAEHTVTAVGYAVHTSSGSMAFQGDSGVCPPFWSALAEEDVDVLIVESAFSDAEHELALVSKHLNPQLLASELRRYQGRADIYVSHPKPGEEQLVDAELRERTAPRQCRMLQTGMSIDVAAAARRLRASLAV
jgi:3',5'-cyclic-nucleotide phosphodiesterase